MKMTYKAVAKAFIISVNDNEKDKLKFIYNHINGYTIDYTTENDITISLDTSKAITPQKEEVKAMYSNAKTAWKNKDVPAEKPAKKVRRRNRQMVKAYNIGGSYKRDVCTYTIHRSYARLRYKKNRHTTRIQQGEYSATKGYFTPFYNVA